MFDPEKQAREMKGIMDTIETALGGQEYLVDNKFSVSDVAVGCARPLVFPRRSFAGQTLNPISDSWIAVFVVKS